jgi:prepilin-type N-terminal cleavage/methylation domain-containing protein
MYSDKGYSLVEVLVGLLIFAVGSLASGALIIASMHQNQQSKEKSVASTLVSQRLEELRNRAWLDLNGSPDLRAGGQIIVDEQLRSAGIPSLDAAFSDTFNYELSGPRRNTQETFFLVMWVIEDLNDSGLDFKRITIKGVSMHWHRGNSRWEPVAAFDHIAMVFREIKVE